MRAPANAVRLVYSRVERTATPGSDSPVAYAVSAVVPSAGWIAVDASRVLENPFEAVKHEYSIANRPLIPREEDSMQPVVGSAGERYEGPRGKLLTLRTKR